MSGELRILKECDERNAEIESRIKPVRASSWHSVFSFRRIEAVLIEYGKDYGGLDLQPDFQRGHKWTEQQQSHFIENAIRGVLPSSAFLVQFNCPNFDDGNYEGSLPLGLQCIDGLQRITAISRFMRGEIKAFDYSVEELHDTKYSLTSGSFLNLNLEIFTYQRRVDVIQHYIDFNSGGTKHEESEIDRVKNLLILTESDGSQYHHVTPMTP